MGLYPRGLLPLLKSRLEHWPITLVTGARQTGKTTLVRDLLPASGGPESVYFSHDDRAERLRLSKDPGREFEGQPVGVGGKPGAGD